MAVVEGAGLLSPVNADWRAVDQRIRTLHETAIRHKTDLFRQLCNTLITPLDPEDLMQLSNRMVATLDEIAAAIGTFRLWFPAQPPRPLIELCNLLTHASTTLDQTLRAFLNKKLKPEHFREFSTIRVQANQILNSALGELFDTETDTTVILRKRDLYRHPHAAVVRCCETAVALRTIALKNG